MLSVETQGGLRLCEFHAAQDWPQLSSYAAVVLRDFNFETYADLQAQVALWKLAEACERSGAVQTRTLGCARMESLLLEMSQGEWALEAMKIVNRHRDLLEWYPRSQAADQAARDATNAEAELMKDMIWNYDNLQAPEVPKLAHDIAELAVFSAPRIEGHTATWSAPSLG